MREEKGRIKGRQRRGKHKRESKTIMRAERPNNKEKRRRGEDGWKERRGRREGGLGEDREKKDDYDSLKTE